MTVIDHTETLADDLPPRRLTPVQETALAEEAATTLDNPRLQSPQSGLVSKRHRHLSRHRHFRLLTPIGFSSRVVSASDCGVRGSSFESRR